MNRSIQFYAKMSPFYDRVEIYVRQKIGDKLAFARSIVLEPMEEGQMPDPMLEIEREDAQTLMDTLWECGLRPSAGIGSVGQLGAIKNHLQDMQKIAFMLLENQWLKDIV